MIVRCVCRIVPPKRLASYAPVIGLRRSRSYSVRQTGASAPPRVAVLYQEIDPPLINGARKPKKPGGYQDSGADIAFNLSRSEKTEVITPLANPDPAEQRGWAFPDTEDGILEALDRGATHLWANTILFASHPLQTSTKIGIAQDRVRVIGQGPLVVEQYDDKDYVNTLLRRVGGFTMPRAWSIPAEAKLDDLAGLSYPIVAKPARGRGSFGVKVCRTKEELLDHVKELHKGLMVPMVEEFLSGEEATVTVMPPTRDKADYWSLPVVSRFNHQDGIAPYNGVVAVTSNSRVVADGERDPIYSQVMRECEQVARFLGTTAPIRVDVRRFRDAPDSQFALFDINMKPNMTGPGRPGRDDQASLTLMAASALNWDYPELLRQILQTASPLRTLRGLLPK
ncbi:glutathione synthetase ATP-binding domain-like protein [Thozetella sp. PMI_491]|nr:glutathione synthetase ATP-binding domain-like protein [Thozetella sp. PMI_491]